jgi:quinoprotein glucose dehydrogenase
MAEIPSASRRDLGARILLVAAAGGLAIAIFDYFWHDNGIHGTPGALLVVISSALMAAASSALLFAAMGRGLRATLIVLIALDIIGTGFASYMLEADWLLAAMAVALIGWILHLVFDRAPRSTESSPMVQRGAE